MKSQAVRILDVLLFGPIMIALASRKRKLSRVEKGALAVIGIGTIIYNLRNYHLVSQAKTED